MPLPPPPSLSRAVRPYPWGSLRRAILHLWWLKALGTTAFIWLFFLAYLALLRRPDSVPSEMPWTALDQWIGFHPWALPVYLSLWVYVSLPTVLVFSVRELLAFGRAAMWVCGGGLLCFYLWPTAVPASAIDWANYPGFAVLKTLDAAGNACPSLHVASAVLAAAWLHVLLSRISAARLWQMANWLWCAGICYSTLATRQHVVVDVVAGALLGGLGGWFSVRRAYLRPFPVSGDVGEFSCEQTGSRAVEGTPAPASDGR